MAVPHFNSFDHMPEGPPPKKDLRDPETKEINVQYTFTTRPLALGKTASSLVISHPKRGAAISGHYEYQGDNYNAQKELMAKELKDHQATMEKMLGDEFKPFSQVSGRKEWLSLRDGNFNSHLAILAEENLPEIPKKGEAVGEKWKKAKPPGAFEHDLAFKPGGVKPGHLN